MGGIASNTYKEYYWLLAEGPRLVTQLSNTALNYSSFNNLPVGNNRPTIVIPGFSTTNTSTYFMRKVLRNLGHNPYRWIVDRNIGFRNEDLNKTTHQLEEIFEKEGTKVNIIGQSLGGCYARAIANRIPDVVNSVVTLGSPINSINHTAPNAIERYNKHFQMVDAAFIHHSTYFDLFYPNPPVPTTSIFSKTDGIVHWSQSIINVTHNSENVEVYTSHFGMGFDLLTLTVLCDRLSRYQETWEKWPSSSR